MTLAIFFMLYYTSHRLNNLRAPPKSMDFSIVIKQNAKGYESCRNPCILDVHVAARISCHRSITHRRNGKRRSPSCRHYAMPMAGRP
ncbi:hypothetical protein BGLA2_1510012 [Burkholderia gladioli]|nr:hypothetical protein BGLA2_1510012 [Burkholderia gladioli]